MPPVAIVTIIIALLIVAALAFYLIKVTLLLKDVNATLSKVIGGVLGIADQAQPIGPVLGEINKDLGGVQAALQGLLAKKGAA
ncbi:MAG: hypothetical protein ACRDYX_02385 [Egibacteraceae bacterium]